MQNIQENSKKKKEKRKKEKNNQPTLQKQLNNPKEVRSSILVYHDIHQSIQTIKYNQEENNQNIFQNHSIANAPHFLRK